MDVEETFFTIPQDIRVKWIQMLKAVYIEKQKFDSPKKDKKECEIEKYCKILESIIFKNCYKITINNGVKIYEYKTKQLFYFEDKKKHLFYNLQSYIKDINNVFSILTLIPHNKIPKDPKDLLEFTDKELSLYSGHAQWLKEYRERESASKLLYNQKSVEKGIFSCPKCKSFKIEMDEKQTRSADEPMTIYCKCEECDCTFVK